MGIYDGISDLHVDFWVDPRDNETKMKQKMEDFVCSLLPENPSEILLIAGDLGHYNRQNQMLLEMLKEQYKRILIVPGNHDYYLVSGNVQKKYKNKSLNRLAEMKELAHIIEGVRFLDGETEEYGGIAFGGVGMWYDFSYAIRMLGMNEDDIRTCWREESNDAKLTFGLPRLTIDMFENEKAKLSSIISRSDVIITHVAPDFSSFPDKYLKEVATSYYCFDGTPFFNEVEEKNWIFGHIHHRMDYNAYGCRFVNASLGYPDSSKTVKNKIISIG